MFYEISEILDKHIRTHIYQKDKKKPTLHLIKERKPFDINFKTVSNKVKVNKKLNLLKFLTIF